MRLAKASSMKALHFSPKRLFRSKNRSLGSRSDPFNSFSSGSSSSENSSSFVRRKGFGSGAGDVMTPTSVLPDTSGDWSDIELLQAFKFIDRDNDGTLSKNQLQALLCRPGAQPPTRDEVALMLQDIGFRAADEDACVSIEMILSRVGPVCEQAWDAAEIRETFAFFDADHDGRITAEELLRVFNALGDEQCTLEECQRMIAEVSKNGGGFVCFEDFAQMMELQS